MKSLAYSFLNLSQAIDTITIVQLLTANLEIKPYDSQSGSIDSIPGRFCQ